MRRERVHGNQLDFKRTNSSRSAVWLSFYLAATVSFGSRLEKWSAAFSVSYTFRVKSIADFFYVRYGLLRFRLCCTPALELPVVCFPVHLQFRAKNDIAGETTAQRKLVDHERLNFLVAVLPEIALFEDKSNDYAINTTKSSTWGTNHEQFQVVGPTKGRDLQRLKEQWKGVERCPKNN